MSEKFYSQVDNENLILRDYLAADRTKMANERTFLAYLRTGLCFLVSGAAFVNYALHTITLIIGWIFIPFGIVTMGVGIMRYRRVGRSISKFNVDYDPQKQRN